MHAEADPRPLLRQEVGRLRLGESRRVFDTVVHVGELAGPRERYVARAQDSPALDPALRTDLVSALIEESDPTATALTVWITRPGAPEPHDLDLEWMAASALACAEHGRDLDGFYAITRTGWLNVQTGARQTWKRLRL